MNIAIDFDGVISSYSGWKGKGVFGDPIEGVKEALVALKGNNHTIIINTTRLEIDLVAAFLKKWEIPYDHINLSPRNQEQMLHPAKQAADVYIDDRAVCFQGKWDEDFLKQVKNFKPWWRK